MIKSSPDSESLDSEFSTFKSKCEELTVKPCSRYSKKKKKKKKRKKKKKKKEKKKELKSKYKI